MTGFLILGLYLLCGVALTDGVFYRRDRLTRLWLGLCAGLIMMMWLPALYAFALRFTRTAQLTGLVTAAALAAGTQLVTRKKPREKRWTDAPWWLFIALVVGLVMLSSAGVDYLKERKLQSELTLPVEASASPEGAGKMRAGPVGEELEGG